VPSTHVPQLHLDNQLCFALHAASRAVVRAYGPLLEPLGLTYPQYLVMLVLWERPSQAVTVGDLGARLHLDSGTLTPLLKRLERSGLVDRDRDPADERRVLVRLTRDGIALRSRAASVPADIGAVFGIDLDSARRLKHDLDRLVDTLGGTAAPAQGTSRA
jgi:DNA-binding MarR family transcriptional regulator